MGFSANLRYLLYFSHFLSTFNSRVFEFSALLFLAELIPGSLLPVSVYAFVRSAAAIFGSNRVGRYVDSGERLQVVRASILGGRAAVVLSCLGFLALSAMSHQLEQYVVLAVLCLPACWEKLCSIGSLVAVEKDWVVVIAGDDVELQNLNAQMRRIDLFCKILGPLLISGLDTWSTTSAIVALAVTNLLSLPLEYFAIAKVYASEPALQTPRTSNYGSLSEQETQSDLLSSDITSLLTSLKAYYNSRAFEPSLTLSMLYFTVLSFSGQLISYLFLSGLSALQITLLRTVSVVIEISATWLAPFAIQKGGPVRAGLWFLSWQATCLVAAASVWRTGWVLAIGVIASRVGLWGFDLAVQFLVQSEVEDTHRGQFSSTEAAVQNTFELLAYTLTIIFRDAASFKYPVYISVVNVAAAAGVYAGFVRKRRGHLLHVACCKK